MTTADRATLATGLLGLLRIGLGGFFVVAGALKLRDPSGFATSISHYQLLPVLAGVLAAVLPAIEIVAGLALVFAPAAWRRAAALCLAALMVLFVVATSWALMQGINVDCGCFGSAGGQVTGWTIGRNLALLVATVLLVGAQPRENRGRRLATKAS